MQQIITQIYTQSFKLQLTPFDNTPQRGIRPYIRPRYLEY